MSTPRAWPKERSLHIKPVLGSWSRYVQPELLGATCLPSSLLSGMWGAERLFCTHLISSFHIRSFVTVTRQSALR
jgi:hypothetical protein